MLIDLDDARALDPGVVGAKAARLAAAKRVGLPVLPGVVVPVDVARPAIATASAALADGGSGAARLAIMDVDVDGDVMAALRVGTSRLDWPLVVRSSSPLETGGVWAGAFSSFDEIGPDDLRTAVRGVWASAFTVHALERCEAAGTDPRDVELAVLLQSQVHPVCAGSARAKPDHSVAVHATRGSPRDLMEGWDVGVRAHVSSRGRIEGDHEALELGAAALQAAAELARRTCAALGDNLIEWAWTGDEVVLLQSSRLAEQPVAAALRHDDLIDPMALRLARLAQRFPGALGEEFVLPWAVAIPEPVHEPAASPSADPAADFARARALVRDLTKEVWQERADRALQLAMACFATLRGTDAPSALRTLHGLRPADPRRGHEILSLIAGVGEALGPPLGDPRALWRMTRQGVEGMIADPRPRANGAPSRLGPDRWEPFIHAAVRTHGTPCHGTPVVAGVSAGRVVVVRNPHDPPRIASRDVLVVDRPLPALAPLLWSASALVAGAGNPAAHLMEVTASLGVPTVLGLDLHHVGGIAGLGRGSFLAAVDGEAGTVTVVEA